MQYSKSKIFLVFVLEVFFYEQKLNINIKLINHF